MNTPSWKIIKELKITDLELKEYCDELDIIRKLRMNSTGYQYCFFTEDECDKLRIYNQTI